MDVPRLPVTDTIAVFLTDDTPLTSAGSESLLSVIKVPGADGLCVLSNAFSNNGCIDYLDSGVNGSSGGVSSCGIFFSLVAARVESSGEGNSE